MAFLALLAPLCSASAARAAGLAVDAAVSTHQTAKSTSIASGAVTTTAANDLLVAFLASDGPATAGGQSFRAVTGGGLTWRLRQRVNARPGTAEIWVAVAPAPLTSVSVTATRSSGSYLGAVTLVAFSGASTADGAAGAGAAASGAPAVTVTPAQSGSWVWGVGNDYDRAVARTPAAGQTLADQYLASVGDTYWVQRQTAAGGAAGTPLTLADTAPTADEYDFAGIEIAPAQLAPPDTTAPAQPTGLTATANGSTEIDLAWNAASDDVGVTGYRVLRDGAAVPTTTATAYRDTGLAPSSTHRYAVEALDAAGNVSADSDPATATTAAPPDAAPPSVSITQPAGGATLSGTATLAAAATDDTGVAGVQFLVDGAPAGAEDTTAPYTVDCDTTAVADGTHTLTARARDAAGNTATSAPVTVTVANGGAAPQPVTLDASVTVHQGTAASSISSPGLTTTRPGELLVAFLASDGPPAPQTLSFSSVTGGGLTWRLRQRTNTQSGTAEIWQAVAAQPVSNLVVTATRAGGSYSGAMTVAAFANASTTVDGAVASANGASGAPSGALTTTHPGSWVWAVGEDYDRAIARTVGSGQTKVDEYLSPSQDTYWVQRRDAATPAAGTRVTIDDTAPTADRWNLSVIEIVAATGPADTTAPQVRLSAPSLDPATPPADPVANNVSATTSPAFSPPAGTVLYAVFSMDSPASASVTTVTSVSNDGTPLTWHLLGRENHNNGTSVGGFVEVWWAANPTAQADIAVTATFSQPTKNVPAPVGDFQILVMDGAAADQSAAAWGSAYTYSLSTTPAATVTTTAPGSRVLGVFDDWDNSNTPQPGADQSILSIVLNATDRDGYWLQAKDTPVAAPGPVTMNATVVGNANAWHALAWEVLAAG